MNDLATLGLKIESHDAEVAATRLEKLERASGGAERATAGLTGGALKANSAIGQMLASIDRGVADLVALQRAQQATAGATASHTSATSALTAEAGQAAATFRFYGASLKLTQDTMGGAAAAARDYVGATRGVGDGVQRVTDQVQRANSELLKQQRHMTAASQAGLNLGRQAADVGVSLAGGMDPFLVLVQQLPQVTDGLTVAKMQGISLSQAIQAMGVQMGLLRVASAGVAVAESERAAASTAATAASARATTAATAQATANAAVAETATAAAVAQRASLTAFGAALGTVGVVAVGIGAAFAISAQQIQAENKGLINTLGLTEEQLKRIENKNISMGDVLVGTWRATAKALNEAFGPEIAALRKDFADWYQDLIDSTVREIKTVVGFFGGAFSAIRTIWGQLPAVFADIGTQAANALIRALGSIEMKEGGLAARLLNGGKGGRIFGFDEIANPNAGAAAGAGNDGRAAFDKGYAQWSGVAGAAMGRAGSETEAAYLRRMRREGGDAKATRDGPTAAERREAALARELAAMKASTQGNMELAAAYGVSDAAALKAAAAVEATGKAIKRQGDVDAFVAAQLELNASKEAASAAKRLSDLRFTTEGQERVNGAMQAGTMLSQAATEQLEIEAQLRPLIAAASVVEGANKAALLKIIEDLTGAMRRNNAVAREGQLIAANQGDRNRLALARADLALVGAPDMERALALAEQQKRLELDARGIAPDSAAYGEAVSLARELAGVQVEIAQAQNAYNLGLTQQLDLARQIDSHTRSAAAGLADAFGQAGDAIGGVVSALSGYHARLEEIEFARDRYIKSVANGRVEEERLAMFARDRAMAQVQSYGDALGAAKSYFGEASDGYRLLQTAEQAFRLFQFAMSAQAMAKDAAETASSIANSAARGTAAAASGAARMFETLGPLGFPAVAAMLALLATLGLSRGGGSRGGSSAVDASLDTAETYTRQDEAARTSFAQTVAQNVHVKVSADRDGLTAYVDDRAGQVAAPMVAKASTQTYAMAAKTIPAEQARAGRLQLGRGIG